MSCLQIEFELGQGISVACPPQVQTKLCRWQLYTGALGTNFA